MVRSLKTLAIDGLDVVRLEARRDAELLMRWPVLSLVSCATLKRKVAVETIRSISQV